MQTVAQTDLVIVGGGPAGSAAAIAARSYGLRVALFERNAAARYARAKRHTPVSSLSSSVSA